MATHITRVLVNGLDASTDAVTHPPVQHRGHRV
jgi:hypothetical protein